MSLELVSPTHFTGVTAFTEGWARVMKITNTSKFLPLFFSTATNILYPMDSTKHIQSSIVCTFRTLRCWGKKPGSLRCWGKKPGRIYLILFLNIFPRTRGAPLSGIQKSVYHILGWNCFTALLMGTHYIYIAISGNNVCSNMFKIYPIESGHHSPKSVIHQ